MAERAAYMNEGATNVVEAGALCKVPALAVTTCYRSGEIVQAVGRAEAVAVAIAAAVALLS